MTAIDTELNYFICTVFGEARGEPLEGIVGVANVIKNRFVASRKTYKDIVLAPRQFSCWNQDDPNKSIVTTLLISLESGEVFLDSTKRQLIAAVKAVYENDFKDNVFGSKNYVTLSRYQLAKDRKDKSNQWILTMNPVVTMGKHIFLL